MEAAPREALTGRCLAPARVAVMRSGRRTPGFAFFSVTARLPINNSGVKALQAGARPHRGCSGRANTEQPQCSEPEETLRWARDVLQSSEGPTQQRAGCESERRWPFWEQYRL